jgi:hypothetical protein
MILLTDVRARGEEAWAYTRVRNANRKRKYVQGQGNTWNKINYSEKEQKRHGEQAVKASGRRLLDDWMLGGVGCIHRVRAVRIPVDQLFI